MGKICLKTDEMEQLSNKLTRLGGDLQRVSDRLKQIDISQDSGGSIWTRLSHFKFSLLDFTLADETVELVLKGIALAARKAAREAEDLGSRIRTVCSDLSTGEHEIIGKIEQLYASPEELRHHQQVLASVAAKMAQQKRDLAKNNVVSMTDNLSRFLKDLKEENESFSKQSAAYVYKVFTLQWIDVGKRVVGHSETVNEIRDLSIQSAIGTLLMDTAPTQEETEEFEAAYDVVTGLMSLGISDMEFISELIDRFGGMSVELVKEFTKYETVHIQSFSKDALIEQLIWFQKTRDPSSLTGNATKTAKGLKASVVMSVIDCVIQTGVDSYKLANWNDTQRQLFFQSTAVAQESIEMLTTLKETYPNDERLVAYCNETISDINLNLKNELLVKVDNFGEHLGKAAGNVAETAGNFSIGALIGIGLGTAGGAITLAATGTGFLTELALGTDTSIAAYENIDLLYDNISESVSAYEAVENDASVPEYAKRFQELNILNQKMAGLDLADGINKGVYKETTDNYRKMYSKYYQDLMNGQM